jgi:hypothetical protein
MRIVTAIAALLVLAPTASPAPTVYFEPDVVTVEEGQIFEMGIRIDAGTDTLTCFLVEFVFDPAIIELTDAVEGSLFSESGHATMFDWDWDPESPGLHQCNDVTLGFDCFVMCPGELVHLTFDALAMGETPITLTAVDLRDIRRERIRPFYTEDATVTVEPETGVGDDIVLRPQLACFPNPFNGSTMLELRAPGGAGEVDAVFHDIRGRVVARTSFTLSDTGVGLVPWSGTALDGTRLPAGVYYVTASGDFGNARDRVTLVR